MTEFYRNLQRHSDSRSGAIDFRDRDKAQALKQAMLTMLKKYPNPKDWAAFTLIGAP
jgi:CHAT domain-containing protein